MWVGLIFIQDIKSRLIYIFLKYLLLVLCLGCCLGTGTFTYCYISLCLLSAMHHLE